MRQYDDPVEVRRGEAEDPEQFLWHEHSARQSSPASDPIAERELWRVGAGRGAPSLRHADAGGHDQETYGVFDLSFDWADGRWQLVGCVD